MAIAMRILYCGERAGNSLSRFEAMQRLGHTAYIISPEDYLNLVPSLWRRVEWRLRDGLLVNRFNKAFVKVALAAEFDLVWIEKGMLVYAETLRRIKEEAGAFIVGSHSDDFLDRTSTKLSRHFDACIPLYDLIFTPRDINFDEMKRYGAQRVSKFWKGFDEAKMRKWGLNLDEEKRFRCDVLFIGHYEEFRFSCIEKLLRQKVDLKLGGSVGLWKKYWPVDLSLPHIGVTEGADFAKAYCGSKIGLNFFSRWARDTQNSRAFEIPATGTFMLCERSVDLAESFKEGREAEFFSDADELQDKITYYLENDSIRQKIAENGYRKSHEAGYSNCARTKAMLSEIEQLKEGVK